MKKNRSFFLLVILNGCLFSCSTPKNVTYFQDLKDTSKIYTQAIKADYEVQIQSDDILEILINSINAEAAAPFNLGNNNPASVPSSQITSGTTGIRLNTINSTNNSTGEGYLVDRNGTIDFPVLGNIKVQGLTIPQLKDSLKIKLDKYLQDPIINVRLLNYKVTVVGEVLRPSTYSIPSERITVMDAIGMAGDLTIYGKRENVLLIREENGERKFIRLNLNSSNIFESPYYYLKQNDIIYVEPNESKILSSDAKRLKNIAIITSVLTLLIVIASRVSK
ncbi:MAG TPA: polysaccharide biosynthesis/export family protein [Parafilimonas sp.]|nr:polysaccharide biosynthesis/export family protein [Parafilimonas sp.]